MDFTKRKKAFDLIRKIKERDETQLSSAGESLPFAHRPNVSSAPQAPWAPESLHRNVSGLFQKFENQALDLDTAEKLIDDCIDRFNREKRHVESICAARPGMAELNEAWSRQHKTVIEALDEMLFTFFDGYDADALHKHFYEVQEALRQRAGYYPVLQQASVLAEQVA